MGKGLEGRGQLNQNECILELLSAVLRVLSPAFSSEEEMLKSLGAEHVRRWSLSQTSDFKSQRLW